MSVDVENFGFTIDVANEMIHWDGGFSTPIVEILDEHGLEAEKNEDAVFISIRMPPDSIWVTIDLRDIDPDCFISVDDEDG